MRRWMTMFAAAALIAPMATPVPASAANALERAIGEAQPCRSLKAKASSFGVSVEIGVDKLDYVKIDQLQLSVNGNLADAKVRGTLACKTSDNAMVQGGFSATADVSVHVDLATCKTTESSIEITDTGGSLGDVVKSLKDEISGALRRGLERNMSKLCQR